MSERGAMALTISYGRERFAARHAPGPVPTSRPDLGPCWLWKGALLLNGYGRLNREGYTLMAHRAAYMFFVGLVPEGLVLDHLCKVRHCVNPSHLEAVTQRVNLLRGNTVVAARAARTHCPAGHEYSAENTRLSKRNQRSCRACGHAQDRARPARRRAS